MNDITQPVEHIAPELLDAWVWEGVPLPAHTGEHLVVCADCQRQLGALRQLAADLAVMRRSQPSAAALDRYSALFDKRQPTTLPPDSLLGWIRATLRWDSRQNPGLAGVRSVGTRSYRIIYSAPTADVELWVVPQASFCSLEGDFILSDTKRAEGGPLVQLHSIEDENLVLETPSTTDGRFRFTRVPAGVYDLWITSTVGLSLVIERLTLP